MTLDHFYPTTARFTWLPDGHLAVAPQTISTSGPTTFHWDGDDVLFAGGAGGQQLLVYVGTFAVINASGIVDVWDRDQTGARAAQHLSNWFSAWSIAPSVRTHSGLVSPQGSCILGGPSPCNATPPTPALDSQREDGFDYESGYTGMSGISFQGVRAFDQTSAQWMTPDAYAGDVNDPMSQKPFMWNNNNGIRYSDPSGYDALIEIEPNAVLGLGHIQIVIYDPKTLNGTILSAESGDGKPIGPMSVVETPVANIRSLPSVAGTTYYHLSTTSAQNQQMQKAYDTKKGGTYNLGNNNCDVTAQQALRAAGFRIELNPIPALNASGLPKQGAARTDPSSIKPLRKGN